MSNSTPILPEELYELFIDEIAARDDKQSRRALVQCSRVCRVFWNRARRHMFSEIQVSGGVGVHPLPASISNQLDHLSSMMTSGWPLSITRLVNSFSMDITSASSCSDIINNPSFSLMLQEFIKAKVLQSMHLETTGISWHAIASHVRDMFHTLCRASHFKAFSVPKIYAIPAIFFDGATIKHLTLQGLTPAAVAMWRALAAPPRLDSLVVDSFMDDPPPLADTNVSLPFSQLVKLLLIISSTTCLSSAYALARKSMRSLQTLELNFQPSATLMLGDQFDVTKLPLLRHIKLAVWDINDNSSITHICRYIVAEAGLETITVEVKKSHDIRAPLKTLEHDPWKMLDKALARSGARRVHVALRVFLVGMFYGTGFVESDFVKETTELVAPLLSKTKMRDGMEFTLEVPLEFIDPRHLTRNVY